MKAVRGLSLLALALFVGLAVSPPVRAAGEAKDLRSGLAAVAQVVKQILDQDKLDAITIGPFVGPTK